MDNDVSVTRLSDDDWNERVPPGPRSRVRVLAVMGAVVVGCGVAAVAVNLTPDADDDRADDYNDAVVVIDPNQTSLYPTPTSSVVETTTGTPDSDVVATDVPVDDTLPTGDAPEPAPGVPGTTDPGGTDPGGDVPGDDDSGRGDDPGDTSTPTTPSDPSTPSETPPPPPPTTTPPPPDDGDEDEDEDEEEECTPAWWIGCWF
mgnify:CR=1 FL=1